MAVCRRLLPVVIAAALCGCSKPAPEPAAKMVEPDAAPVTPPPSPSSAAASEARLMSPQAYVKSFYDRPFDQGGDPTRRRALFEPVLAEALIKDASQGEVGAVDFALECGCQDGQIKAVTTSSREIPGGHEVTASFTLEGAPTRIVYTLQKSESGYKIANISAPAQNGAEAWNLRILLGLDKA